MVELLRRRAAESPSRRIYTFLRDGEEESAVLDLAELDRRARSVAARLQRWNAQGERALLLYPPGLDFIAAFFASLYAGVIAVPVYPPSPGRTQSRLGAVAEDARPRIVLTTSALLARAEALTAQVPALVGSRWLATDEDPAEGALEEDWDPPDFGPETVAFLQYTSGSTSSPKGVVVTHRNLLHNQEMIGRAFGQSGTSTIVSWLPLYHDMGLIGGVLHPLYVGASCVLMSPLAFLQRPVRWLQAVSRYGATASGGPNFAYELCLRRIGLEERSGLDLSRWSVAFNGAEPVRAETLERFAAAFGPCGFRPEAFYPCYGLAEATLFVSGGEREVPPRILEADAGELERGSLRPAEAGAVRRLVSCGRAWSGQEVTIVDPETRRRCPAGRVGEIWVSGPSVAPGYWNRPEVTARVFGARLADKPDAGPFLTTGDLGCLFEGELHVTGRSKDLIILRGRNLYPQDLELTVESGNPQLRPGGTAAFAVEVEGEERLVVLAEVERGAQWGVATLGEAVRRQLLDEHEVELWELVLLAAGRLPKTSSGKIMRHACREAYTRGEIVAVGRTGTAGSPPGTTAVPAPDPGELRAASPERRLELIETYVHARLAAAARAAPAALDRDRRLGGLALESLAAVELAHAIETDLGVTLPVAALLEAPRLRDFTSRLVAAVEDLPAAGSPRLEPIGNEAGEHPVSAGQRALWFLQSLAPQSAAHNIVAAARVRGGLDVAVLQRSLQALIDRHAALRTTFSAVRGEPVQTVHETRPVDFRVEEAGGWSEEELDVHLRGAADQPFDLREGPLLRVRLYQRPGGDPVLLLVVHHIVSDLWSLSILVRELQNLYQREVTGDGPGLPPLVASYADYVRWHERLLAGPEGERLWEHWRDRLAGARGAPLELLTDRLRPPVRSDRGAAALRYLPPELAAGLSRLARRYETTLFAALLAAFQTLLYRFTGQEDVLIGSPTAGRSSSRWAGVLGYFVNPVPLRASFAGGPSFTATLDRSRQSVTDAVLHQDFPFPLLVERMQPQRDPDRLPFFEIVFVLERALVAEQEALPAFARGIPGGRLRVGGLELESWRRGPRRVAFDLSLHAVELEGEWILDLEYRTDLFGAATAHRMLGNLQVLLQAVAVNPDAPVAALPLLTPAERLQLLEEWNATERLSPEPELLQEIFAVHAARAPQAEAVAFEGQSLSYAELEEASNRWAHHLRAMGVGPEVLVGVCLERSLDQIVALLALLKAGGAYVPLDPEHPAERLAFVLEETGAPLVLTQSALADRLPENGSRVVVWEEARDTVARRSAAPPAVEMTPDHLVYVIYTSGSTGRPKGAMLTHRGIRNRLLWGLDQQLGSGHKRVLYKAPLSFDVSVWEIFAPLLHGSTLVVARPGAQGDSAYLADLIREQRVTHVDFVPSLLQVFLEEPGVGEGSTLERITSAGEALAPELLERSLARLPGTAVLNVYGPTEASLAVTYWHCEPGCREVPIGRPMWNARLYVVDRLWAPVPVGVPGEICIGGTAPGRGYWRRPDLTAERFVPDGQSAEPDSRVYRTGDLGRWRADGMLEFLGRIDHQVKVRGFRIELGEIEAALLGHPGVRETVVLARENGVRISQLVAYVVGHGGAPAVQELRRHLRDLLPEYMVPSLFVELPEMPLTPNGKVDRGALPAPDLRDRAYTPPRNETEETLRDIWAEILGVERVGIDDDFFALGGHSLLVSRLLARIEEDLRVSLPLRSVFESPTPAGLAETVRAMQWIAGAATAPATGTRPGFEEGDL